MGHGTQMRRHLCGIQTAWTDAAEPGAAVAAVAGAVEPTGIGHLMVFFSPTYDPDILTAELAARFPGVPVTGCTTSGGISPAGSIDRGLVAIAFPRQGFRIVAGVLTQIARLDVEGAASTVRGLRRLLDQSGGTGHRFAISLIDALANAEETVVSAVAWALDGIPLIGGSAGDDLAFRATVLIHEGRAHRDAAVILLVETDFPIRIFKSDNFEPTSRKFVVTAAREDERRVYELNAEPAAREYAMAVGLDPERLTPMSFAAYPLAVKIGGEYYCRSISRVEPDGSLTFFCAIGEGVVMTLAQPRDIVEATRAELAALDEGLGGLDLVIGFDCVFRRLDAESRQVRHRIADLYRRYSVVGFETYGEQYRSMHLNQTFTGIAIGRVGAP
ncbi:FIST N-terminal domain-containing protein [Methylobacterium sp. Leaf118]|uniref:FIST N-terminal domain-containing protein n=1 Tax=Methylobacterium sp. Leaf118 TaxID=2876562 RepID=UPI001E40A28E|nr:FIST N-terminal domain-containing protein [Methylobacterium sp. Leaf118]